MYYNKYISKIKQNDNKFNQLILKAKHQNKDSLKLFFIQEAYFYAATHCVSAFIAPALENMLLDISQKHNILLSSSTKPNSVLHVLTSAYKTGGHTSCVTRWINLTSYKYINSCVLLKQFYSVPESLRNSVSSNKGKLFIFNPLEDLLKKGLRLRKLASFFELIVLHIHPDDITPILAFGNSDFKIPVIFFNHANHMLFSGVSIADLVLELNEISFNLSKKSRQIKNNYIIGIPPDIHANIFYKKNIHKKNDKKIIFISGSPDKFNAFYKNKLIEALFLILAYEENCIIFVVGPFINDKNFKKIINFFPDRILLKGLLKYDTEWKEALSLATLVIESWPISGATTRVDAIYGGKPVLTLDKNSDFIYDTEGFCSDINDLVQKTLKILNNSNYAEKIWLQELNSLYSKIDALHWQNNLDNIINLLQKKHTIKRLDESKDAFGKFNDVIPVCLWIEPDIISNYISKIKIVNYLKLQFYRLNFIKNIIFFKFHNIKIKLLQKLK